MTDCTGQNIAIAVMAVVLIAFLVLFLVYLERYNKLKNQTALPCTAVPCAPATRS